jgi:hypothetical protein
MRYRHNKLEPEVGDVRYKKAFLFFPRRIGDETRWFEEVTWVEEFQRTLISGSQAIVPFERWVATKWYP